MAYLKTHTSYHIEFSHSITANELKAALAVVPDDATLWLTVHKAASGDQRDSDSVHLRWTNPTNERESK